MRDDVIQILSELSDEYSARTELYLKIRDQYLLLSSYIPSGDADRIRSGMEFVDDLISRADICTFRISAGESSLNRICGVTDFFGQFDESGGTVLSGIKQKRSESRDAAEKMVSAGMEFFAAAESAAEESRKTADELNRTATLIKFLPENK